MPFKLMDLGDQYHGEFDWLTEFDGWVELYNVYVNQMSTPLKSAVLLARSIRYFLLLTGRSGA